MEISQQELNSLFNSDDCRHSEGDHLEDPGVGRIILICIQEVGSGGIDWIDMAQDRDRWWAFVNVVMNLRVP